MEVGGTNFIIVNLRVEFAFLIDLRVCIIYCLLKLRAKNAKTTSHIFHKLN